MPIKNLTRAAAALVASVMLLAACSGNDADHPDSSILVDQDISRSELADRAVDEGTVSYYTTVAGPTAEALASAFEDAHPGIAVEVFTGNLDVLASKIASENQAGRVMADVIEADNFGQQQMREQELIQPFYSPSAQDLPADARTSADEAGLDYFVDDRVLFISAGYNPEETDGLSFADLDDLLVPELKGRMAVAQGTVAARWVGGVLEQLGQDEGTDFIRRLGEQDLKLAPVTTAALADLLVAGQYAATPSLLSNAPGMRKDAPLEWVPLGTAVASTGSVSIADGTAHPAAAALFADFLVSPEGQAVYAANGYTSPGEEVDFPTWDPLSSYPTTEEFNAAYEQWQGLLEEYVL